MAPEQTRHLLIVGHTPSPNTRRLRDAIVEGTTDASVDGVRVTTGAALETGPEPVLTANGVILLTPENLGTLSGGMKDFFDRIYYPCLEPCQGMPFGLIVRAGHDGTGTCRAVETIVTGLRWRPVADPLVLKGPWREEFVHQARELGQAMAAGLEAGIF